MKRFLSLLLCFCLIAGMALPAAAVDDPIGSAENPAAEPTGGSEGQQNEDPVDTGSLLPNAVPQALSTDLGSGTCGTNLTWVLSEDGTLTISGTGTMTDYSSTNDVPWYDLRTSIKTVVIENGVISIGDFAFAGCTGLTEVTIPNGVTSIGEGAFEVCTSLTKVTIPGSVTSIGAFAFSYCSSLTEVTIPNGVTSIGKGAFELCTSLTKVTIPGSVTTIGDWAFCDCDSLTNVTIPGSVTSIGDNAFYNCSSLTNVTIPEGVTSIGGYTFYGCTKLTSVTIPNSVTSIGIYAFFDCRSLTNVTIPGSVTSIGNYAFWQCSSLTYVTIPEGVTSIGFGAFDGCSSLTEVTIPGSVASIGGYAFRHCSSLTSVTIPENVTSIGDYAFYNCTSLTDVYYGGTEAQWNAISIGEYNEPLTNATLHAQTSDLGSGTCGTNLTWVLSQDGTLTISGTGSMTDYSSTNDVPWYNLRTSIKTVIIESGVTSIGGYAFYGCESLPSVTIPGTVTSIGDNAFYNCSSLTNVTIPEGVTSIGGYTFYGCTELTSVTIPNSVTSIGIYAFSYCSSLTNVTIPNSVTSIGIYAFFDCSLTSVTIPGSVTSIGKFAFYNCTSLTDVYYGGTEAQWNAISIGKYNEPLTNATLHAQTSDLGSGTCGTNLTWVLSQDGTLTISGTGSMTDYSVATPAPWDENRDNIKTIIIGNGVTTIGDYAFYGCESLPSVTIPGTVTSIGNHVFDYCDNLTELTIREGVTSIGDYAFAGCGFTSVTIPNSVTSIGEGAFSGCRLTEVTIPGSVTSIGDYTFFNCSSLTEVTIPGSVTSIGKSAFSGCGLTSVTIPNSVTTIGDWAFAWCGLTSVTIPGSVTSIGNYAFWKCSSLTNVTIPGSVTSIGGYAFAGCENLTEVTIPEGVTSIGKGAFDGCSSLTSVTIPKNVTSIGDYAFYNCTSLTDVYYGGTEAQWNEITIRTGNEPLQNATLHAQTSDLGSGTCGTNLTWVLSQDGTLTISGTGDMADYNIYSNSPWYEFRYQIQSVVIETGVTSIGTRAFYDCKNLTSISIPDSVTSIGEVALDGCRSLRSITIPAGVTSVGSAAFNNSTLTEIIFKGNAPRFESDSFYDIAVVAYYPRNNATWTQNVMQNYGGTVTWRIVCTDPQGHSYNAVVTDPTCTEQGYTTHTCSRCHDSYVDTYVAAKGHDEVPHEAKAPTCTEIGWDAYVTCSRCDYTTYVEKAALGHDEVSHEAKAPTCTEIGWDAYVTCSRCDYTTYVEKAALGHDEIPHEAKAPTCTEKGWDAYVTCSRCDYSTYAEKAALGHTEVTITGKPATCTEPGLTDGKKCSVCDVVTVPQTTIDPLGHDEVPHEAKAPTCTEVGWDAYVTCSRCDYTTYVEKSALGHDLGEWTVTVEPTPEAPGVKTRVCSRCDYFETETFYTGNRVDLTGGLVNQSTIWVDGVEYAVQKDNAGNAFVFLPEGASDVFVTYSYTGTSGDVHTQYPTGMKVYRAVEQENGSFTAEEIPELENLLRYSGCSIRITGKRGIRMITSVDKDLRAKLTAKTGLKGLKLLEYGTALCWASDLEGGKPLVLGQSYVKSNYAYKKGVSDPVFARTGNLIQYTNVLVGFTLDQCADDIAMRPYITLEDENGETFTVYGGIVYRSIGYIAYQNRNVFKSGTAAYDYVWEIIHAVYGDQYDADFKG